MERRQTVGRPGKAGRSALLRPYTLRCIGVGLEVAEEADENDDGERDA
jgi:hypothetical protein